MCDLYLPTNHNTRITHARLPGIPQDLFKTISIAVDTRPHFVRCTGGCGAFERIARRAHAAHLEAVVGSGHLAIRPTAAAWKRRGGCITSALGGSEGSEPEDFAEQWSESGEAAYEHAYGDLAVAPDHDVGYGN